MTGPVLQLDDFGLTDLEVHWLDYGAETADGTGTFTVGYEVEQMVEDGTRFRLTIAVTDSRARPSGGPPSTVKATGVGFFTIPESTAADDRARVIRVNGLTMLYGSLRGALAAVTGLFPPDFRYVLPTVNMLEVIEHVEGDTRSEPGDRASAPNGGRGSSRPRRVAGDRPGRKRT